MNAYADWKNLYGDITKLYKLQLGTQNTNECGWKLIELEYSDNFNGAIGLAETYYYPYSVGFRRLDYSWEYQFVPSVNTAISEAFDFFTTNPKSNFLNGSNGVVFERGSSKRLLREANKCSNEYYRLATDSYPAFSYGGGIPLFGEGKVDYLEQYKTPLHHTYMYNYYYKVFIAQSQPTTITIREYPDAPQKDKIRLLFIWWGVLTIIMLAAIIPLSIKERHSQKKKEESLYERLIRLCNPTNYMKDYDKEKVDKANSIYQRLLETNQDDSCALISLQEEAVSSLGINMIEPEDLEELTKAVNPQRFMNPYNADKVTLANELYSRLKSPELTYKEYCVIEEKAKELEG